MPRSEALNQEMRTRSRTALLEAGRQLFASHGYFKTTIAQVARQAGMSQGNVYLYFAGKEDLLKAILAEGFTTLDAILAEAAALPGDSQSRIAHLLDRYLAFGREGEQFFRILISLLGHGGADYFLKLGFDTEQIGQGFHRHLAPILAQGQAEGFLEPGADPQALAAFFFAFFNGLLITYGPDWLDLPAGHLRTAVLRLLGARGHTDSISGPT